MSEMFVKLINMSFTASYVIIFVMIIRLFLRKTPKIISYLLWSVVGFRLMVPVTFESIFSLLPQSTSNVTINSNIIYETTPQINSGIQVIDKSINKILPTPIIGDSINPLQIWLGIGTAIWIIGVILLISYSIVATYKLKTQLKGGKCIEDNIYEYEFLKTPFVFGIIKPKIYLPTNIRQEEREYIILHEQIHIQRKDYIVKMMAFFITSIYWFNPLVWGAYILMSKDMEYACDEKVLTILEPTIKKSYATSLLSLAMDVNIVNGGPIAFGEGNVKGRIKNILNYKKPTQWVCIITGILIVAISIGLITNPVNYLKLGNVDEFPKELSGYSVHGTLNIGEKYSDLNNIQMELVVNYLRELRVSKYPNSNSRTMNRDDVNQIHIVLKENNNEDVGNIYFNFDKDFSSVWIDNEVKPSFSYSIKRSNDIKNFLENQMGAGSPDMEIRTAKQLWNARTPYIGDNSSVGKILNLLPIPQDIQYNYFKLNTSEQPYGVEIVYSASSEVIKQYDVLENKKLDIFRKNALILLALIDNADTVTAVLEDGDNTIEFTSSREWAEEIVGGDVRDYANSPEELEVLISNYFTTY